MVRVAVDAGPLHGPQTGIGRAVRWTLDALDEHTDVDTVRYVVSARARLSPGERRLPLPAAAAHRLWSQRSIPPMDRWLGHPDVVHGTNYVVPPARASRLVSVYDCWFLEHPDAAHPDVRRAGATLRRAVADGAHVVTSSDATTEQARQLLGTELVHTIHLGPPPSAPAPRSRPAALAAIGDAPFIAAISTRERRKNLPLLIRAFAQLAAEHPSVELVIAGRSGDDDANIHTAIAALDAPDQARVHLLGAVDDDTKHWLLHHATALAYPSLDEGFGFPILEAQLTGTPVVASAAGSIPEVAGSGALLSLANDAQALAANLFGVVSNTSRREQLIEAGHRNVERFSWASTAMQLDELYRALAN